MAPIATDALDLEDDQRMALMKFRRSVQDVLTPAHNDYFLLRWLRARQWNPEAAEKMLRDSLAWREKWKVDKEITTGVWEAPETLKTYFPSGSTGFDKEGSPVIILPFAGLDVYGLLHAVPRNDIIRMVIKHLEGYLNSAAEQAKKFGPKALKVVAILDMEGFSMKQYTWRPAGELVFTLIQMYEAHYPEILKNCYVINAPKIFSFAFSIVKKFMHENTISKISIIGQDTKKWQPLLLQSISADQLPVHYGGSYIDESGDPRCINKVKLGGKVPKEKYTKNINQEDGNVTKATVKNGEKLNVELICAQPGCFLKWDVGADGNDIMFEISRKGEDGKDGVIYGPKKLSGSGTVDAGLVDADGPATYTLTFDNSDALLKNKKVFYDAVITKPVTEMILSADPDDDVTAL